MQISREMLNLRVLIRIHFMEISLIGTLSFIASTHKDMYEKMQINYTVTEARLRQVAQRFTTLWMMMTILIMHDNI